jgi:hypothetical protein
LWCVLLVLAVFVFARPTSRGASQLRTRRLLLEEGV